MLSIIQSIAGRPLCALSAPGSSHGGPVLERTITHTTLAGVGDLIELAVTLADDGTLIGDELLALRSVEHQTLEVGYIFAPAYGGQGFATEAVRALLELAFGLLGVRPDIVRVDHRKWASRDLLDRLGSVWKRTRRQRVVQGRADQRGRLT